jgi:hypothetical protein
VSGAGLRGLARTAGLHGQVQGWHPKGGNGMRTGRLAVEACVPCLSAPLLTLPAQLQVFSYGTSHAADHRHPPVGAGDAAC